MYAREYCTTRPCKVLFSLLSGLTLICNAQGFAKPDMQPLGPNIADKGSSFYHFSVNQFDSADGSRHYRVWTAVPNKAAPASGYPVLYMLDGNAVMDRLNDELLKQLAEKSPPVIVAVGYQTNLPFDLNGRAYDYTPAAGSGKTDTRNGRFSRKSGGSSDFRQLLETRIAPKAEEGLKIDRQKRGLWGHSYGGLFVLDSWLSSSYFQTYYSASPSLGRGNDALLSRISAVRPSQYCAKRLAIMEGSATPGDNRETHAAGVRTKIHATLATLKDKGVNAAFWDFPNLGHGPMFNASFRGALLYISGENAGTQLCNDELRRKSISALIPSRKGAGYWPEEYADRNRAVANHHLSGSNARWKWTTEYIRRSIAETAMYRVKKLFGGSALHDYDGQVAEALAMVRTLNKMAKAGMPESVRIA